MLHHYFLGSLNDKLHTFKFLNKNILFESLPKNEGTAMNFLSQKLLVLQSPHDTVFFCFFSVNSLYVNHALPHLFFVTILKDFYKIIPKHSKISTRGAVENLKKFFSKY